MTPIERINAFLDKLDELEKTLGLPVHIGHIDENQDVGIVANIFDQEICMPSYRRYEHSICSIFNSLRPMLEAMRQMQKALEKVERQLCSNVDCETTLVNKATASEAITRVADILEGKVSDMEKGE